MKFITDSMLGRLARWLRLSGYDVLYSEKLRDEDILELAVEEGRIVLTRDKKLKVKADVRGVDAALVISNDLVEQLRQLAIERSIDIKGTPVNARCPLCNSTIKIVAKNEVAQRVPENVLREVEEFWKCVTCGKIYWHGGHWKKIKEIAERI
jgi:hypothetical protein